MIDEKNYDRLMRKLLLWLMTRIMIDNNMIHIDDMTFMADDKFYD